MKVTLRKGFTPKAIKEGFCTRNGKRVKGAVNQYVPEFEFDFSYEVTGPSDEYGWGDRLQKWVNKKIIPQIKSECDSYKVEMFSEDFIGILLKKEYSEDDRTAILYNWCWFKFVTEKIFNGVGTSEPVNAGVDYNYGYDACGIDEPEPDWTEEYELDGSVSDLDEMIDFLTDWELAIVNSFEEKF